MSVVKEVAEWSKNLPKWQSDAVRRIFTQDELSADDEEELLKMLLAANGIVDKDNPATAPEPFSVGAEDTKSPQSKVVLNELHTVLGVNALIPDQAITFALDGLTIVYGENGAGKSGYSRVLKHSCHAREKNEPLHPNVAVKAPPKPSAVIELTVDGNDIAISWTKGMAQSVHLLEVAVFDSHCARVFLDDANEVVYLPYGSDLFPKLASLMNRFKSKIRALLAAIPTRFALADEFSETTVAGGFVRGLSAISDPARVDVLGRLDEKETKRLAQLRQLVATAKVNPPKEQAAQLRRRKARLEQLKQKVTALDNSLAKAAPEKLKTLKSAAQAATTAASLASTEAFKDEPLKSTGSEAWRLLFDAAKTFSTLDAYPDVAFPVVGEGATCVWCQQLLSDDAKARLKRFEKFVTNDAATRKAEADKAFKDALKAVTDSDVRTLEVDATYLDDLRAISEALATKAQTYFTAAQKRKDAIVKACESDKWETIPDLVESPAEAFTTQANALEDSAKEFDKADNPEALQKLEKELSELDDRERLAKYTDDIKLFIAEKIREASLSECERAVDTNAITRFGSELVAKSVTDQLETCLAAELLYFSVHNLPLQLKKSGEKGKTKHQLTITSDVRPSVVLSEGEQRVVAIACFLAELRAVGHQSPIVFDDPVSSLDHLYREKVAVRLANEAKKRQVVVFTHDITFLLALERQCGEGQIPRIVNTVRKSATGPGECTEPGTKPWDCQSTNERIGQLKQRSASFKKLQASDAAEFERQAKDSYGDLREAWERAIEEVVLNGVIGRFDPSIQTKRLKAICMEPADYATIDQEMTKCSTRFKGHDTAPALSLGPLTPDDIDKDIKTLETFVKQMRERQKTAQKEADELLRPPAARVASKRAANTNSGDEKLIA